MEGAREQAGWTEAVGTSGQTLVLPFQHQECPLQLLRAPGSCGWSVFVPSAHLHSAPAELAFQKLPAGMGWMLLIQAPCGSCLQTWAVFCFNLCAFYPVASPCWVTCKSLLSVNPEVWLVEEGVKDLMVHVWWLISAKRVPACGSWQRLWSGPRASCPGRFAY